MRRKGLILLALILLTLLNVVSTLTTTVAAASTTYWKVNINLVGSGTLTVAIVDPITNKIINQSVITQSTSFLVPNGTVVYLKSNQSFVVNNQGMITKYYGQLITNNTTLTVNFDVQNVKLQLIEVKIVLLNNGSLITLIANLRTKTLYTNMTINQTTTLGVPPNSTIALLSKVLFRVVNSSVPRYYYIYIFNVTGPMTVAILFASPSTTTSTSTTTPSTTTSSTAPSSSTPPPPPTTSSSASTQYSTIITLTAHTEALTLITSSTPSSSSTTIYYIIIAVLIVAVVVYLLLRRRK